MLPPVPAANPFLGLAQPAHDAAIQPPGNNPETRNFNDNHADFAETMRTQQREQDPPVTTQTSDQHQSQESNTTVTADTSSDDPNLTRDQTTDERPGTTDTKIDGKNTDANTTGESQLPAESKPDGTPALIANTSPSEAVSSASSSSHSQPSSAQPQQQSPISDLQPTPSTATTHSTNTTTSAETQHAPGAAPAPINPTTAEPKPGINQPQSTIIAKDQPQQSAQQANHTNQHQPPSPAQTGSNLTTPPTPTATQVTPIPALNSQPAPGGTSTPDPTSTSQPQTTDTQTNANDLSTNKSQLQQPQPTQTQLAAASTANTDSTSPQPAQPTLSAASNATQQQTAIQATAQPNPPREKDTARQPTSATPSTPPTTDAETQAQPPTQSVFRTIERPAIIDYAAAQRAASQTAQTASDSTTSKPKSANNADSQSRDTPLPTAASTAPDIKQHTAQPEPLLKHTIAPDTKPTPATDPKVQQAFDATAKKAMNAAVRQSGGSLNMRLTPDTLGTIRIALDIRAGVATVNIQVGTQAAADLLANALPTLRTSLESNGLSVERLSTQLNPGLAAATKDDAGQNNQRQDNQPNQQQWGSNTQGGKQGSADQRSQTYEQARQHLENAHARNRTSNPRPFDQVLHANTNA